MSEPENNCASKDLLADMSARQQLDLLRALVDATGDAIIAHEPGGQLVFYNRAACELLGMTRQQITRLTPFGWVNPESMQGAPGRLETILRHGRLVFPSSVKRSDGSVVPTEVTAVRVETEIGPMIVAVIHDTSARNELEARLRDLAYHDALTGLANRVMFDERMAHAITYTRRYKDMLALAYIDLDHFKPINDGFGHRVGDQVLIEVAHRLVSVVRVQDLVVRLGGDEFVIVLQRVASVDEIPEIGRRLHESLHQPMEACGNQCQVDASIGFSIFDPDVDDARSLLVKADQAMYAAKRDPGSPWLVWHEGLAHPGD